MVPHLPLLQDTANWPTSVASVLLMFSERLEAGRGNLAYSFAHTGMLALAVRCGLRLFELGPETYSQVGRPAYVPGGMRAAGRAPLGTRAALIAGCLCFWVGLLDPSRFL